MPTMTRRLSGRRRPQAGGILDISKYPYPPGKISTRQAVELIAAVVYPNDNQTAARKRVRERLRYARAKNRILASSSLDAPNFFRWALDENPDWASLALLQGLPRSGIVQIAAATSIAISGGKVYAAVIPGDPLKLRDEFSQCQVERQKLMEEVEDLKKQIAELQAEVAEWRGKDRAMREKRSEAGKKGGRGNFF